jgi:hypothetical protein
MKTGEPLKSFKTALYHLFNPKNGIDYSHFAVICYRSHAVAYLTFQ